MAKKVPIVQATFYNNNTKQIENCYPITSAKGVVMLDGKTLEESFSDKADNSVVVHKSGDEEILGRKTFETVEANNLNLYDEGDRNRWVSAFYSFLENKGIIQFGTEEDWSVILRNIADPEYENDAATKGYVDIKIGDASIPLLQYGALINNNIPSVFEREEHAIANAPIYAKILSGEVQFFAAKIGGVGLFVSRSISSNKSSFELIGLDFKNLAEILITINIDQSGLTQAVTLSKNLQSALTDTDGGYGQRVAELEKEGIASQDKLTELDDKIGVLNTSIADRLYSLSFSDLDTIGYYNTLGEFISNVNMVCKKIDIPAGTKKIITHSAKRDQVYETIVFFDADGNCVDFVYNNSEFYEYPVKENYSSVAFSAYKINQSFNAIFSAEPLIGIRKTEDPELNRYFKELYLANIPSDDIYIYVFTTNGQTVITKSDFSPSARLATGNYDANTGVVTITANNNSGINGYAIIDKDVTLPSANYTTKQGKIIKTEVTIERNPFIATKVNKGELDAAIDTKVDKSVFDAEIATKVNKDEFDVYETNFAEGVLKEFTLTSQVNNIDITSIINKTTSPCVGLDIKPYSSSTCPLLLVYNGSTIVTQVFVKENQTNVGDGWTYVQGELTLPAEYTSVKLQLRCVNLTEIRFRNLRISNSSSNNIDAGKLVSPYAKNLVGDVASAIYGQTYGKKLVCLGDSITYQHQWQPHLVTMNRVIWDANDSYPGINHPLALGGAHVLPMYRDETEWTSGSSAGEKRGTSIYYMADYVKDCNPDIIIVFGGTNDITYLDHIGTINDEPYTGEEVPYANIDQVTFYGAYKGMLQKLTTQNQNAKIYAMTIMYPWYNVPSDGIGYFAEKKALYNKAIRECAALYSVEVIDLCYDSGINLFNAGAYYKEDSSAESWVGASARVHPNELGGEMMAKLISRHLK